MLDEGSHNSEGINSNFEGNSECLSIRIMLGWHIPPSHLSCLEDMLDFRPRVNPQALTYTSALLRCPHWQQHYSLYINWVYGSCAPQAFYKRQKWG